MPPSKSSKARRTTQIPVPEDPDSKYAPNTWLSGGSGNLEDLTLPSGQLCLVRRPGMQGLIAAGVLQNMDSLSAIVNEKHIKPNTTGAAPQVDDIDVQELLKNEQALQDIMYVIDKIVVYCVVRPQVVPAPGDVTLRKPNIVYTDMIDLVDKMFVFNFVVGGTRDLDSFRGELDEFVGSMADGQDVSDEAQ